PESFRSLRASLVQIWYTQGPDVGLALPLLGGEVLWQVCKFATVDTASCSSTAASDTASQSEESPSGRLRGGPHRPTRSSCGSTSDCSTSPRAPTSSRSCAKAGGSRRSTRRPKHLS